MKPTHKHDCEKCHFVGTLLLPANAERSKFKPADLYESCETGRGLSYIIRYSSKGSNYVTTTDLSRYLKTA